MLRKADVRWNNEMHARLRVLARARMSFTDIAAAISHEFGIVVSRNACIGKAHRMGIVKKHRSTNENTQRRKRKVVAPTLGVACVPNYKPEPVLTVVPRWRVSFETKRPPAGERVTIEQLERDMCKWPYGDRVPYTFCGRATAGKTYCAYHTGISCGMKMTRDRVLA